MKKIYMVKKNPNMPESEDNWIMMNGYEFARFMETEEGQSRKKNFAQIDACGEEDDIYVVECGEERAKEWRSEKDAHDYLKECEAESGFETISFDSVDHDGEEISLEELIADLDADVLRKVLKREEIFRLRRALKKLQDDEYELIRTMFLGEKRKSERATAKIYGVSCVAIHNRKIDVFEKIKIFL